MRGNKLCNFNAHSPCARPRSKRDDCGDQLVFERRPASGLRTPDPCLFVMESLSWGGGAGKTGTHVVRWGLRVYPCSQFCVVDVFVL